MTDWVINPSEQERLQRETVTVCPLRGHMPLCSKWDCREARKDRYRSCWVAFGYGPEGPNGGKEDAASE
jgi:hypothetical protein